MIRRAGGSPMMNSHRLACSEPCSPDGPGRATTRPPNWTDFERRLQTTRSERGRDRLNLYQAGVIDSTEMRRRSAEIETRSRRFDQERQALIARQTELATDNRLHQHITGFAQQALAGIDALDFEGRQQLMRLMLEDVRVRGWQVELRLRIPLDINPPTSPASDKPKRTRARSPRGRPAKEAVSSNDRLRSIGERQR